jgi:hypothetical protein
MEKEGTTKTEKTSWRKSKTVRTGGKILAGFILLALGGIAAKKTNLGSKFVDVTVEGLSKGAKKVTDTFSKKGTEQVAETVKETVGRAAENAGKQFNNYRNH